MVIVYFHKPNCLVKKTLFWSLLIQVKTEIWIVRCYQLKKSMDGMAGIFSAYVYLGKTVWEGHILRDTMCLMQVCVCVCVCNSLK